MTIPESSDSLSAMIETNYLDGYRLFSGIRDVDFREDSHLASICSGVPVAWLNGVLKTTCPPAEIDRYVNTVVSDFRDKRIPMYWRCGVTSSEREELALALSKYGLNYLPGEFGMILEHPKSAQSMPSDFTISELDQDEEVNDWMEVFSEAFELAPPVQSLFYEYVVRNLRSSPRTFRFFIGRLKGQPVSCCSYLWSSKIAVIYNVGTKRNSRGQGFGSALTDFASLQAQAAGHSPIALYSSEGNRNFYQGLGFQAVYRMPKYELTAG